jgi:hypothetical protein
VIRAVAFAVLAGCVQLDPSLPIQLVPDGAWGDSDVATLQAAADCWNLRFGMHFEVARSPSRTQVVFFRYDALACWGSWGRYEPGEPAVDAICPIPDMIAINHGADGGPPAGYRDAVLLFTVAEHELGHAAGILGIDRDPFSVMGTNYGPSLYCAVDPTVPCTAAPVFSNLDVQMLRDAVPSFVATPQCADVVLASDVVTGARCTCL